MPTLIQCRCCNGSGSEKLPEHLEQTLAVVPKRGFIIAEDVAKLLSLETPNAASNRLTNLLEFGLVTRERHGKYWRYARAEAIATHLATNRAELKRGPKLDNFSSSTKKRTGKR